MDRTRWIIFGLVVLAALSWLVFAGRSDSNQANSVDPFVIQREGAIKDNVYGNPDAKVVLFEYGDFQCPGCRNAYPAVKEVKEKYKDQIAFVYRHYPITTGHPNALAAAAAAEAAGEQGKFWEMHDKLFENQMPAGMGSWNNASAETRQDFFEQYASEIGLNMEKFRQDIQSEEIAQKISFDRALGRRVGVNSTPTFFINGQDQKLGVDDWRPEGALEARIVEALKRAGVEVSEEPAIEEPQADGQSPATE